MVWYKREMGDERMGESERVSERESG